MNYVLIIIAFAFIGAGLKYIDCAFDEDVFNTRIAIACVPVVLIVWIWVSILDVAAATILFAILFAVLLSGKVDNVAFLIGAVVALCTLLFVVDVLWIPLMILTIFGIVDEKGNDYVDRHQLNKSYRFVFKYRGGMELCMLGLCMFSVFPWIYLFAFLIFDGAYLLMGFYGTTRKCKKLR